MPNAPLGLVPIAPCHADFGRSRPAPASLVIGSGWLESSWDLRRGLVVSEGWPRDASLAQWFDAFFQAGAERGALPLPA